MSGELSEVFKAVDSSVDPPRQQDHNGPDIIVHADHDEHSVSGSSSRGNPGVVRNRGFGKSYERHTSRESVHSRTRLSSYDELDDTQMTREYADKIREENEIEKQKASNNYLVSICQLLDIQMY